MALSLLLIITSYWCCDAMYALSAGHMCF